jgi:hypothetical protein
VTAAHYRSNLRDIYFNLFEVLRVQDATFGRGPYAGFDEDTARAALGGLEEFVQASFANSFVAGDRQGARFDGAGNVTLPAEVTASLRAYYEGGWHNLELPEALGGMGAPPSVGWAGFELLAGSHAAATFFRRGHRGAPVGAAPWCSPSPTPAATSAPAHPRWPRRRRRSGARGRQALHHQRRLRPRREHRAPGARPPGGRGPGTKGSVDVHRAQVLGRGGRSLGARNGWAGHERLEKKMGIKASVDLRGDATAARPAAACWWARSTTASARCSTSSSRPAWPWA